jgi:hypothetical protein
MSKRNPHLLGFLGSQGWCESIAFKDRALACLARSDVDRTIPLTVSECLVLSSLWPPLPDFDDADTSEADLSTFLFFDGTVGSRLSCGWVVTSSDSDTTFDFALAAFAI